MSSVWDRVHQLEGATLATLSRNKPFKVVSVLKDRVRVIPQEGNGTEHSIRFDRIENIASKGLQREELRQRTQEEYETSRNSSYIAAIVHEVTKNCHESEGGHRA